MTSSRAPLVTVLLPVYNGEPFLRAAAESILTQTVTDLELLVVDDGSTDRTPAVLAELVRTDGRVRVLSEPHRGLVSALNRGLEEARGRYIARMDADDVSYPTRLEKQIALMERDQRVGVCGTWVDHEGGVIRHPPEDERIRAFFPFDNLLSHPTVVMRRSLLAETGERYPDVPHAEDYALWTRLAGVTRFANVPEPLLRYRDHPGKVGRRHWEAQRAAVKEIRRQQLRLLGVEATEGELALHHAIAEGSWEHDRRFLAAADAWLRRLGRANAESGALPRREFDEVLADRWYQLCGNAAGQSGPSAALVYLRSPLAGDPSIGWLRRLDPLLVGLGHLLAKPDLGRRVLRLARRVG